MAADRQRLAQALAAEAARRKMFESIPEAAGQGLPQAPERPMGWNDYLENLSIGLGRGAASNLEGIKGMVTSPVETLKGVATGVTEAVRNPRMVAEALKQIGQRAMSGPLGLGEVIGENVNMMRVPGKPVMHELDVYHGTPHRFPATEVNPLGEFDASKIGTGEGAQAYGHGIYYAENPDVAKGYQSSLSADRGFSFEGKTGLTRAEVQDMVNAKYGKGYLDNILRPSGVADSFIDDMVTGVTRAEGSYPKQYKAGSERAKLYDELRGKITHASPGSLYKADLPDEMIGRMLDWDKPLSEQPTLVKQLEAGGFLKKAPAPFSNRYTGPTGTLIDLDSPGGNLVMGGGWNQKTSAALRDAGIPGIKYLDAGSRGAGGTGTRNFVVFPGEEKKVRILERK
jgi:hypothetical protein